MCEIMKNARQNKLNIWNILIEEQYIINHRVRKNYVKHFINFICAHIKTSIKFSIEDACRAHKFPWNLCLRKMRLIHSRSWEDKALLRAFMQSSIRVGSRYPDARWSEWSQRRKAIFSKCHYSSFLVYLALRVYIYIGLFIFNLLAINCL